MSETIFALATPPGRSGVAVIRVAGSRAHSCAAALGARDMPPRAARTRRLVDPATGATLDHALVLRFDAPRSFTGDDVVEFHVHGGPAVVQGVLTALSALGDMRVAEPGEFTRRALLNGKLDLAQVEGLGDLLAAETRMQARQALALMDGRLSHLALVWREGLLTALATLEASIDFSDDGVSGDVVVGVERSLADLTDLFDQQIVASHVSERIREGFEVAFVGAPNVGKSTLLNALARRDVAIVSEFAGTTRDVLEVRLDLAGLPVTILDTAGIRATSDPIEAIGVARSVDRARRADLRVLLIEDGMAGPEAVPIAKDDIVVLSKADLRDPDRRLAVSGVTGAGLTELLDRISSVLGGRAAAAGPVGHARQRECLERARESMRDAAAHLAGLTARPELAALEVRAALGAIDGLVGGVDTEQVLDVIFRNFCLGK